jgi:CheY-like chemotaxis protein
VLVIDDDPLVLNAIASILAQAHDVTAVSSALDALTRIAAGERFELVLCDLMMPGVSGVDLIARLRVVQPELAQRVIFLSGGAATDKAAAFVAERTHPILEKPFAAHELLAIVRRRIR